MESMTTRSGRVSCICRYICSRDVSVKTSRESRSSPPASGARRSALNFICRALSSPETYRMRLSFRARTVCNTRVLLPMPGSPPSRTRLPGTRPPPSTRFSSPSKRSMRGSCVALISDRGIGLRRFAPSCSPAACNAMRVMADWGFSAWMCISFMVFHLPQAGHLPTQRTDSWPQ